MIIAFLTTFSIFLLLISGFALLLQNGTLGENSIKPAILATVFVSALIGVLFSLQYGGRKMDGVLPAVCMTVLMLLGRIVIPNGKWDGSQGCLLILAAMLPAVFVIGRKKRRTGK